MGIVQHPFFLYIYLLRPHASESTFLSAFSLTPVPYVSIFLLLFTRVSMSWDKQQQGGLSELDKILSGTHCVCLST